MDDLSFQELNIYYISTQRQVYLSLMAAKIALQVLTWDFCPIALSFHTNTREGIWVEIKVVKF